MKKYIHFNLEYTLTVLSSMLCREEVVDLASVCLFFVYSVFRRELLCQSVSRVRIIGVKRSVGSEEGFLENVSDGTAKIADRSPCLFNCFVYLMTLIFERTSLSATRLHSSLHVEMEAS